MMGRQHTSRTAERPTGGGAGVYGTSYSSWWWYYHREEETVS